MKYYCIIGVMNLIKDRIKLSNKSFICSKDWNEIKKISDEKYNIAILERQKDTDIDDLLNKLLDSDFNEKMYFSSISSQVKKIIDNKLSNYKYLNEKGYQKFLNDIDNTVKYFSQLSELRNIEVLFGIVNTTQCPLFHYDSNYLRLICSYKGKGTLWLENNNVNFDVFGKKSNDKIVKDKSKINSVDEYDIAILKGTKFHKNNSAVIHKSPELSIGEKRIVLRLDAIKK